MKTSYLIIGGLALAGAAYWYTHRSSPAKPTTTTTTTQTTTGKVFGIVGSTLQSIGSAFGTKTTTTARSTEGDSDVFVARANSIGLSPVIQELD
jgi:hypothetical protein